MEAANSPALNKASTNSTDSPIPPPMGAIDDVDNYGLQVTALKTAMELDVFDAVAKGQHTVESIATATQCSIHGMGVLLDAMCALKLVQKTGKDYYLTLTSQAYLVSSSPTYATPIYLAWLRNRDHFIDFVRTGQAQLNLMAPQAEDLWVSYAAPSRIQWPQLAEQARKIWTNAGVLPLTRKGLHILDIGCGAGIKSFALLQDDPSSRVTAIDSPKVLEVASDIADQMQVSGQVSFHSGEVAENLSPQTYDFVLYGSLLHYYPIETATQFLKQAYDALKDNGIAVIYAKAIDEERTESAALLSMIDVSNCAPYAQHYTVSEYKAMLQAAGFVDVSYTNPTPFIGHKRE